MSAMFLSDTLLHQKPFVWEGFSIYLAALPWRTQMEEEGGMTSKNVLKL